MSLSISSLLTDAPQGRHFCQLHKSPETLAVAVGVFVGGGLQRNDSVVVVASDSNWSLIHSDLQYAGVNVEKVRQDGQLVVLDSNVLLDQFMCDGTPDWTDFRKTIVPVIESARKRGRPLRVYGEMVNDLWRAANTAAAIRLEEFWNELSREYRFCLFCGYELDGLEGSSYAGPVAAIARTHTDVLSTDDDERLLVALDKASRDVLAIPLSAMLSYSGLEAHAGEHRLPIARRTLLWLQRNIPSSMDKVLRRARHYYQESA